MTAAVRTRDWMLRAACRGDTEPFHHEPQERGLDRTRRDAVAESICRRCPVKATCFQYATENHEVDGVYGGVCFTCRRTRTQP